MNMEIEIEISARHIHLCQDDADKLFGRDYNFKNSRELSQPRQYAYQERITVKGDKGKIVGVRVLGPMRRHTQVELSRTDAVGLGIDAPLCLSGNLEEAAEITLIGPQGEIIVSAAIVAKRHAHLSQKTAQSQNIKSGQILSVEVISGERKILYHDVIARVSGEFNDRVHLDTDEANAGAITPGLKGKLIL